MNIIFAALDFIIDKEDKCWFLEVNGNPGIIGLIEIGEAEKVLGPLRKLCKGEVCLYHNKKTKLYEYLNKHLCPIHDCRQQQNSGRRKYLLTEKNTLVKPDVILRRRKLSKGLHKQGITIINSEKVMEFTTNKHNILKLLGSHVNTPKSYLAKTPKHARKLARKFSGDIIVKPNRGKQGKNIHLFKNSVSGNNILLEEVITPKKRKGKYWDTRIYVVSGKAVCGMIRESENMVTNLHKGGIPAKMNHQLFKRLSPISEKIVQILESNLV